MRSFSDRPTGGLRFLKHLLFMFGIMIGMIVFLHYFNQLNLI
jgi:hypothetical protein